MKRIFLTICAIGMLGYASMAQFHFELGPNFNMPQGDFADSYDLGIGFYIEPRYAMTENIDLGLYIGANAFAGADVAGASIDAQTLTPVLATGTYRLTGNSITPYAGLGLGMYFAKAVDVSVTDPVTMTTTTTTGESSSEFGFAPRAGLFLGRMNLGVVYNVVKDSNFIQFNLGVRILGRG